MNMSISLKREVGSELCFSKKYRFDHTLVLQFQISASKSCEIESKVKVNG